jgi:hypothetical protein
MVRYGGFINVGKKSKVFVRLTHPTNEETGFLSAFWLGGRDLGKKPGFWVQGNRPPSKETGFISAFWLGGRDLGKKPGFWVQAIAPQSKKPGFYQHFAWVTNMWLRNPVSGYKGIAPYQ